MTDCCAIVTARRAWLKRAKIIRKWRGVAVQGQRINQPHQSHNTSGDIHGRRMCDQVACLSSEGFGA